MDVGTQEPTAYVTGLRPGEAVHITVTCYGYLLEIEGTVTGCSEEALELRLPAPLRAPLSTIAPGKIIRLWHKHGPSERAQVIAVTAGTEIALVVRTLPALQNIDRRRTFARLPVNPTNTLLVLGTPGRVQAIHALVVDVSGGGCGIVAPRALPIGASASLRVRLAEAQEEIVRQSEVRARTPLATFHRAGLMFVELSRAARDGLIRALVAEERHWRTEMGLNA